MIDLADLDRRISAQEQILIEILAHAKDKDGDLLGHLERVFSSKGTETDREDSGPDTARYAHGIIDAARRLSTQHTQPM